MVEQGFWHQDVNILAVFGTLLIFGVLGSILAHRIKGLPSITALMILGLMIGPWGLGLISHNILERASVIIDVALGLILYKLGTELHLKEFFDNRGKVLAALFENAFSFGLMLVVGLFATGDFLVAAMIAAICMSSSPAVLVHVAHDIKAHGPVTEHAKSLVAMNNLFSFVMFSIVMTISLMSTGGHGEFAGIMPFARLFGSILIGVASGVIAAWIARLTPVAETQYRYAVVIGSVMLCIGGASMIGASTLLGPLVMGYVVRLFERRDRALSSIGLGSGGELFFIVLFVMAGAKINPENVLAAGWLPIMLIAARFGGKTFGIMLPGKHRALDMRQSFAKSVLLVPMAGMAIGLTKTTQHILPDMAGQIGAIVFAMVAILETIGPALVAWAFRYAGEADRPVAWFEPPAANEADNMQDKAA